MATPASPHFRNNSDGGAADRLAAWRERRLAALNADDGPPTLVRTVWLDETSAVDGVPGRWSATGSGAAVDVDGKRQQVGVGGRARFDGATVQVVVREGRMGVRVFDHARAGTVAELESFPFAQEWVVAGAFEPLPARTRVGYGYALESAPRETEVAGILRFDLGGRSYETRPMRDGDALLLVFADATTGERTKPPGRFLDVVAPDNGAGVVELDFNRAVLPPCAFSDEFNCPLPPPEHRLAVAVEAGEAQVFAGPKPATRAARMRLLPS